MKLKGLKTFTANFGETQEKCVLILPGWGGSHKTWSDFADILSKKGYSVTVLDLPGFGGTETPKDSWGLKEYGDFVDEFIKKSNENFEYIIGHSFGCRVLSKYLSGLDSRKFKAVVYTGAAGIKHPPSLKIRISNAVAKIGNFFFKLPVLRNFKELMRKILYKIIGEKDYYNSKGVMKEVFKNIQEDLRSNLSNIKERTLIIYGRNDTYVPYTDGVIYKKEIKDSELIIYEDGRHGLHLTHKDRLSNDIDNFFRK